MSTMHTPAVSVIMPVYNGQRFLAEAVESIINQLFTDFEFLIMDDGSTDASWQILQNYAKQDKRIKLFQQSNQGVGVSLNNLIALAQADLIARMDADDISHSARLQSQLEYLSVHPQVGVLSTGTTFIAPNGLAYCTVCFPNQNQLIMQWLAANKNPITHGAVMFRKSLLLSLEHPIYKTMRAQDLELWQRLMDKTQFGMLTQPLYFLRQYSGSITDRWHNKEHILAKRYINNDQFNSILNDLDNKLGLLLRPDLNPDQGYECFLNARALFLNHCYYAAIKGFLQSAFTNKKYRYKSLILIGFVFLGPIGIYFYAKLRLNANEYEQLPELK